MRHARFKVSLLLLERALGLPTAASIVSVSNLTPVMDHGELLDWVPGREAEVVVEDWSLPEADTPHDVTPVITDHYRTWSWGVEGVEPVAADGPRVGGDPVATHSSSKEAWQLRHDLVVRALESNRYRTVRLLTNEDVADGKLREPDEYEAAMWSNVTREVLKAIGLDRPR